MPTAARFFLLLVLVVFALGSVGAGVQTVPCCSPAVYGVACQPDTYCDIRLLPGDDLNNGAYSPVVSQAHWIVTAQDSNPPNVYFKARSVDAPPTLLTIPTPMHVYHFLLIVSPRTRYFAYYIQAPATPPPPAIPLSVLFPTPTPRPTLPPLHGHWQISGRAPFQIMRVGTDGKRTFVFVASTLSYPVPLEPGLEGGWQTVNFAVHVLRYGGREYIIAGVPPTFFMSLGGGKHRVFLTLRRTYP